MKVNIKGLRTNVSLRKHTTLEIGGPAKFFVVVRKEKEFLDVIRKANKYKIPFLLIGAGSNLLVHDDGYNGLVVCNKVRGIKLSDGKVRVKSGTNLGKLINFLIENGFSGVEAMSGIPGTVGGAVCGNAGAYGQTISDNLTRVKVFDGKKTLWIPKKKCNFKYRESIFKKNKNIILEIELEFPKGKSIELKEKAKEILSLRKQKYPDDLRCSGSFFKNILVKEVSKKTLIKIPKEGIVHGIIPAGYLLEAVGAKGAKRGDIKIADYHGNLIVNLGQGKASDFYYLVRLYFNKVKEKFGINLEPEVKLIGFEC